MNLKLNKKCIWTVRLLEYKIKHLEKEKDSKYMKGLG